MLLYYVLITTDTILKTLTYFSKGHVISKYLTVGKKLQSQLNFQKKPPGADKKCPERFGNIHLKTPALKFLF